MRLGVGLDRVRDVGRGGAARDGEPEAVLRVAWNDEDGWKRLCEKAGILAWVAQQGGARGLALDFEPYGKPMFRPEDAEDWRRQEKRKARTAHPSTNRARDTACREDPTGRPGGL